MQRIQILLSIIIVLLFLIWWDGQRNHDEKPAAEEKPWVSYALNKERKKYEWWLSRFASQRECQELMLKEIHHELPAGHWLRGANLGDWYSEPIGCGYTGPSAIWTWTANLWLGGSAIECINYDSSTKTYVPVLKGTGECTYRY